MERNNQSGGNTFIAGLFTGAILGGAAVFLLGTKKGNKVLKLLTEEGLDSLSHMSEKVTETIEEKVPAVKEAIEEMPEQIMKSPEVKDAVKQVKKTTHRFFKKHASTKNAK